MNSTRMALLALLLMSACGGNPFVDDPKGSGGSSEPPPDPTNGVTVPETVNSFMKSATYAKKDGGPITVNMSAADAASLNGSYKRDSSLDVAGYKAYTHQESGSNRFVLALVSDELSSAKALIAMDAGQFGTSHAGGLYSRAEAFTAPTGKSGAQPKFNYSGTYAGLVNFGDAPGGGPEGDLNPTRAYRTTGRVLVTADFVDMKVSGGVDNRSVVDTGDALATIFMDDGAIDKKGNFAGTVKRQDVETDASGNVIARLVEVGDYAGIFAGKNASQIAALYLFKPIKSNDIAYEQGIFVSGSCVEVGGPACRP